jgi:ATP-dependent exoDNAse (exonuclease V), alpha sub unit - helicase superfamily I member
MNRGPCGTRELNRLLQAALNPVRDDGGMNEVERFGWTFRTGDRVIQTENNYEKEVFNGDIGTLSRVDAAERDVSVEFENRKSAVRYDFGELDQLAPAYAITVHKSQGSEFAAVVIPIVSDQFLLLQRNLLYTAVTRGRQLVVVVAQTRALQRAVRETGARQRVGGLLARLTGVDGRPPERLI